MIPAEDLRRQFLLAAGQWSRLLEVDGLNVAGLMSLRTQLRSAEWDDLPPDLVVVRADLLDYVCRLLVNEYGWPAGYLLGIGDVFPDAPKDASSLVDGDPEA